jgi:dipicolinate synthase subunit B
MCGSFCTLKKSVDEMEKLALLGIEIQPIMSERAYSTSTRFGTAKERLERIERITGRSIIHTVEDAEPLGPTKPLEALIIAPCTGNTLGKMANAITDGPVTMAAKAHLRSDRPTLIALASNDSLSAGLKNIATLLARKQVYFVPMRQDDPLRKPHSLVADFTQISEALEDALAGRQRRPLFL